MLRLFCVTLLQTCQVISSLPPNMGSEVAATDTVVEGGALKNHFARFVTFLIVANGASFYHLYYHYNTPLSFIEMLLFSVVIAAFALRMWCYRILGRHFTFTLLTKEDHKLIDEGPYRYLIHPSYTGQLLQSFATLAFFRSYLLIGPLLFYAIKTVLSRIQIEEAMMMDKFKDEYKRYIEGKYRLIPYVY